MLSHAYRSSSLTLSSAPSASLLFLKTGQANPITAPATSTVRFLLFITLEVHWEKDIEKCPFWVNVKK